MQNEKQKTIVLTGGGTAGHVTPNIALIPHLRECGFTDIHYIGTSGMEKGLIEPLEGITYHEIEAGKLRRYFSLKNLTDPFKVIKGYSTAKKLIKQIKPDVVFSKGGFVSVPVVLAAKGICPIVAHESDYTPGLATKISARAATKICVSFKSTLSDLPKNKAVLTGSPIRDDLFSGDVSKGRELIGVSDNKPVIMVMGGSLGALALNNALRSALPRLLEKYNIVHICGKGKVDESLINTPGYKQFEYVKEELPHIFAVADIVISRAGANSVFEFLALTKPAILVPLPSKSSRGDQLLNATEFSERGFAMVLNQEDITEERLIEYVERIFADKQRYINNMLAEQSAKDGTKNVINVILSTLK